MKGVAVVIEAVLILAVVVSLGAAGIPVAQKVITSSVESAEIANVRADFLKCGDKILDTARTGSGSKCALSASEGKLSVRRDGIYYSLLGNAGICAPQDWALVDLNKQIWQRCEPSSDKSLYELKWFYPKNDVILLEGKVSITSVSGTRDFSLYQKGTLLVEFDSPKDLTGKTIELTRYYAAENTTVLSVSIG